VQVQCGSREQLKAALFHTLQVFSCRLTYSATIQHPYEKDDDGQSSGYDDQVHEGVSYAGYHSPVSEQLRTLRDALRPQTTSSRGRAITAYAWM
jgi:hypothetical protein